MAEEELAERRRGHPKEAKVRLALELVERFHSRDAAVEAQAEFDRMFGSGRGLPDEIPERDVQCRDGGIALGPLLRECGLAPSTTEASRLVAQGGVEVDGRRASDPRERFAAGGVHLLRVGKRRVCRVKLG